MAALELDPMFRRGLRLLHSRNRDSAEQLKLLLDEAVRLRQGKPLPPINKVGHYAPPNIKDSFALRRESPTPIPRARQSSPIPLSLKRDDHKKDKNRDEDNLISAKRPRLESPMGGFKSHTPSPTPSLKSESSSRSRRSDESDSDEMNDLAMEIMDGINCNVCKSFEVSSRNQLVECQECHALYHQECHKPPVTDQDVNDPRLVWYCVKCTKTMKKQGGLVSSSNNSSSSGSVTRGGGANYSSNLSGVTSASASSAKSSSTLLPTRPTASPTKGLGLSRPSPFTNLASATTGRSLGVVNSSSSSSMKGGLGSSSSSSSSNNSNSSSKAAGPSNSMLSAERRMHMMKKKAAAKMAEKRKL